MTAAGSKESLTSDSYLVSQFRAGQSLFRNAPDFDCMTVAVLIGKRHSRIAKLRSPLPDGQFSAGGNRSGEDRTEKYALHTDSTLGLSWASRF